MLRRYREKNDAELLGLARDGDPRAFEAVYGRHREVLLAFLARRVPEPELAADLLAETFASLLVLVQDDEKPLPLTPAAWLIGTARHLLIDAYRRGQVESRARQRLETEPLILEDRDLRRIEEIAATTDVLGELARALTPDQFDAVRARVVEERDYRSIARDLRCSEAVVRKRVSRGLNMFRGHREARDNA
jgi:RNA polymerase sigma-70 factor (ECF subfamily)